MAECNYYINLEEDYDKLKGDVSTKEFHKRVYDINVVMEAYRELSKSKGRFTVAEDGTNFKTLENYTFEELRDIVEYRLMNKIMNPVKRIYIPKANGKKRPIGIVSIWDKLVEKCLYLTITPYVESRFVNTSFGFRSGSSPHNAIARVKATGKHFHYALSIDMESFFDTLDPNIIYRELYRIGIKDKYILNYIFRLIKKGFIDKNDFFPTIKGAPQGSVLGPLFANVYLDSFDKWFKGQTEDWHDKSVKKFHSSSHKPRNFSKTGLKYGCHVRFADDILILCKTEEEAIRFKHSICNYLEKRLKLKTNSEKTRIYNLEQESMKYLGYDLSINMKNVKKASNNRSEYIVSCNMPKATLENIALKARRLLKEFRKHPDMRNILKWNIFVIGIHNYYQGLNNGNKYFKKLYWKIYWLYKHTMQRFAKRSIDSELKNNLCDGRYKSWGNDGFYTFGGLCIVELQWFNYNPVCVHPKRGSLIKNPYIMKGGEKITLEDLEYLRNTSGYGRLNSRFAQFRVSKYSAVGGKSYLSGEKVAVQDYHCHHMLPRYKGGSDDYSNLCVLEEKYHKILHSSNPERLYNLLSKKSKPRIKSLIEKL